MLPALQEQNVRFRAWQTQRQPDLSMSCDTYPDGSYEQQAHDQHMFQLITDMFRNGEGRLRSVFR
jgi:hypothetical protein